MLLGRRWGLARAGIAKYPESPLFVSDVDISARVHQNVLRLRHELRGNRTETLSGSGRNKPARFLWHSRILDVENTQTCVEVRKVDQIALLLHVREMLFEVRVVRPDPATLVAEVCVRFSGRWRREREDRHQPRFGRILNIDHRRKIKRS